jgi:hypothetical protein
VLVTAGRIAGQVQASASAMRAVARARGASAASAVRHARGQLGRGLLGAEHEMRGRGPGEQQRLSAVTVARSGAGKRVRAARGSPRR